MSGSGDKTVKVWNVQEKREEFTLNGHASKVSSVGFSGDGKYIVSGSYDNTVKVWNVQEKQEEFTLNGHAREVSSVEFSGDGKYIVSGSHDNTVKVWNVQEKREEFTLNGQTNCVLSVGFSGDSKYIVSGFRNNCIKVWDIQEKKEILELCGNMCNSNSFKFSWNGNEFVSEPSAIFSDLQNEILNYQKIKDVHVKISLDYHNNLYNLCPQYSNDPYFQDFFSFKNVSQLIYENKLEDIPLKNVDIYFSNGMYRPAHIAAFKGDKVALKKWLNPDSTLILRTDCYGKSPFFYSISKGNLECSQIIMNI